MPPRDSLPSTNNLHTLQVPTPLIPDPEDGSTLAGLTVTPAKQLTVDAFNAMFYAYPGVGKTTIAGMFADYPSARDVLIVDAEGGASVLAHRDHVDVVQVQKWSDVERVLLHLERTPTNSLKYHTVCFDNVTELQAMHLQSLVGSAPVEIQHYGINTATMMRLARRVRDLSRFRGINTVLIAWQEVKVNKLTSITRQTVALTEKLANRLPGVPNIVGHISIMNNPPLYTRKLSFAASPLTDAKFRRSAGDASTPIPDDIYYSADQNPIADMLRTLYEGAPFPAHLYLRPKGKVRPGMSGMTGVTTTSAQTTDEQEDSD